MQAASDQLLLIRFSYSVQTGKNFLIFLWFLGLTVSVIFSFTGPDPVATAQAIRAKQTNLHMITLGSSFGFWKETLDITGDPQNLFEVPNSPEIILPIFLPKVAWRALCSGIV